MRMSNLWLAALTLLSLMAPGALWGQTPKVDAYGDALPAGAIARLGTVRWRHGDGATFVSFLPDGKTLLSVGRDATVRQWDVATGRETRRFGLPRDHQLGQEGVNFRAAIQRLALVEIDAGPYHVALSTDGKVLVTCGAAGAIHIWDAAAGKQRQNIGAPEGGITAVALAPDGKTLAVQCPDGSIRLHDTATGQESSWFGKNAGKDVLSFAGSLTFSSDGKKLASVSRRATANADLELTVWEPATGKALGKVAGKETHNDLRNVAFSPDGKRVAWVNHENKLVLADAANCKEERRLADKSNSISGFAFTPDGTAVVASGYQQSLVVFDVKTGKETKRFKQPDGSDWGCADSSLMAFAPDGKRLALGAGAAIAVIDFANEVEINPADAHRHPLTRVSFGRDGKQVFTMDEGQHIRIWDSRTGKPVRMLPKEAGFPARSLAEDGRLLGSLGSDGSTIHLQDIVTGKQVRVIESGIDAPLAPAISADNKLVAVAGAKDGKGVIAVYEAATGKARYRFALPVQKSDQIVGLADEIAAPSLLLFAPDSRTLAAVTESEKVLLWDVTTGRELPTIQMPEEHLVRALAFAPDGRSLVLDCGDGVPRLYETTTGQERRRYETKPAAESEPAPKDPRAAVLWKLAELDLGGSWYADVAISPDGKLLAHSRPGGTIALWDVAARKELGQLAGHQADVMALAFSADGKLLASGSRDTTVLLWDVTKFAANAKRQVAKVDAATRWNELAGSDAVRAFDAVCALAAGQDQAVPFLKENLRPIAPVDAEKVQRLIGDLDNERFADRKKASAELEKIGEPVIPLLRKALEGDPSPEARKRIEEVLKKVDSIAPRGELLRSLRAIEVLETIGTPEAQAVLKDVAKGTAGATVTRAAKAALGRLGR